MTPAFESVGAWLAMGHHGVYVWSCWLLTLGCLVAVSVYLPHERRRFWRDEAARQRRQVRREQLAQHSPSSPTSTSEAP